VQELNGVFDGDQVIGARSVDAVDHRGESGGLTGTGGSRNQYKPALLFANFVDHRRQVQFVGSANLGGNNAEHHTDVAALLKYVYTEAAQARYAVRHI
jgi:hypothetical protein